MRRDGSHQFFLSSSWKKWVQLFVWFQLSIQFILSIQKKKLIQKRREAEKKIDQTFDMTIIDGLDRIYRQQSKCNSFRNNFSFFLFLCGRKEKFKKKIQSNLFFFSFHFFFFLIRDSEIEMDGIILIDRWRNFCEIFDLNR